MPVWQHTFYPIFVDSTRSIIHIEEGWGFHAAKKSIAANDGQFRIFGWYEFEEPLFTAATQVDLDGGLSKQLAEFNPKLWDPYSSFITLQVCITYQ